MVQKMAIFSLTPVLRGLMVFFHISKQIVFVVSEFRIHYYYYYYINLFNYYSYSTTALGAEYSTRLRVLVLPWKSFGGLFRTASLLGFYIRKSVPTESCLWNVIRSRSASQFGTNFLFFFLSVLFFLGRSA